MKAPFKAGDIVIYRSRDLSYNNKPMEISWCGLGRNAAKETGFEHVGNLYADDFVVIYADNSGYDRIDCIRKFTKLEKAMK